MNSDPTASGWRPAKRPRQSRSRATVEAILEAATEVLNREGYDETSTNKIAARAGVSIGSLYQYFPNKDVIIGELQRRHQVDMLSLMDSAFATATQEPLTQAVRVIIRAALDTHRLAPEMHRVFAEVVPPTINAEPRSRLQRFIEDRLRVWIVSREDLRALGDPDLAVMMIMELVENVIHRVVAEPTRWRADADHVELELTAMIVAYLAPRDPEGALG